MGQAQRVGSTARPRISVVVDEHVAETLRRVAAVQGESVSRLVGDMLRELEPGLRKVAVLGEQFEAMTEAQMESLRQAVLRADEKVGIPLAAAFAAVQQVDDELHGLAAESVRAMAPTASGKGSRMTRTGQNLTPLR